MRSLRRSHWVAFATAAVVLVVLALGGYLRGWDWTGFKGNTLWDWLHLLVLPRHPGVPPAVDADPDP